MRRIKGFENALSNLLAEYQNCRQSPQFFSRILYISFQKSPLWSEFKVLFSFKSWFSHLLYIFVTRFSISFWEQNILVPMIEKLWQVSAAFSLIVCKYYHLAGFGVFLGEGFLRVQRRDGTRLMYRSIPKPPMPPPGKPPGIWLFWKILVKFPTVRSLTRLKCPGIARGEWAVLELTDT